MDVFGTFVVKTFGTLKFAFLSEVKQRELLPLLMAMTFRTAISKRQASGQVTCHCKKK